MPSRELRVTIIGDDASLQRALGAASAASAGFGDKLMATGARVSAVGKKLTTHLTLPLLAVGAVAGKSAVDFQNAMELLHTQAGVGQDAIAGLSKSVLALAGPTATAPDELAAGLYHLASQGLRGAKALDALRIAAEGAKMGQANLEDVTNALGGVIASRIKGVSDLNQAMGMLNATVGAGDMRMQDLADAMGTGLATNAAVAGVSLRDVSAALAVFGDNNIRGAKAGTLLSSAIRLMSAPSKTAQTELATVGISADDLAKRLAGPGGLAGALEFLRQRMEKNGLTTIQQSQLLSNAFGGKQATGVKLLIDELGRLQTKEGQVTKGGKTFADNWTAYTQTTAYHLASMGAQMQATGVTIGTILLPVVAKIADVIGRLAARFEALSPTTQKVILVVAGLAAAIGPLISVVGALTTAVGFLAANPLVLAVAGIAALAAAIAAAVVWPDKLKSVLEKMGLSAHQAGEVIHGLQAVFQVVKDAAMAVVGVIEENWPQIKAIAVEVFDIVKTVIMDTVKVVEGIWRRFGGTITSVAETAWNYVKGTIRNALEVIRGIVDVISGLIHGDWSRVWQGIQEIVGGTLKQIWNQLHTAISTVGAVASAVGHAIWSGITWAFDKVVNAGKWFVQKMLDLIRPLVDAYNALFGSLTGNIPDPHHLFGGGGGSRGPVGPQGPTRRAGGGPVFPGIPYMVGEAGRELFVPSSSGTIVPHNRLGGVGGGDLHIHVHAPNYVGNKRELVDTVVTELSKYARRNGNTQLRAVLGVGT